MHVLLRPAHNKLIFSIQGSLVVSSWESDPFGIMIGIAMCTYLHDSCSFEADYTTQKV